MAILHHPALPRANYRARAFCRTALAILFALVSSSCGFVTDHEVGIKVISHRFDTDGNLRIRVRPQHRDVCGYIEFGSRSGPGLPSGGVCMVDGWFWRTRAAPPHASPVALDPDGTFEIFIYPEAFDAFDFRTNASSNRTVHLWINNAEVAVFDFPAPSPSARHDE